MNKIFDDKISISRPFSRIQQRKSSSGDWLDGEVVTPNGIVSIQAEDKFARLDFSYKSKLYMRNYYTKKCYSPQYLVTLADRFSKEINKKY
jgi:hypothetical protein